ncbi:hypothetical protein D3C84_1235490 [compost metagenome]
MRKSSRSSAFDPCAVIRDDSAIDDSVAVELLVPPRFASCEPTALSTSSMDELTSYSAGSMGE